MVGALPVGIQTREDNDIPYWPVQSTWTYKEVWVHPVARWVWLMRDLFGPALVEGQANSAVVFKELNTGQETMIAPDPVAMRFRAFLAEGKYIVRYNGEEQPQTILPGETYNLDLRPGKALSYEITSLPSGKKEMIIKVTARGAGSHHFNIRTDNLAIAKSGQQLALKPGQAGVIEWRATISSPDTPWVVVVIPDDDISQRKELRGE
jgi:hypothetical protein